MINLEDKTKCVGCAACVQKCPKHCIDLKDDMEGFWYPSVNLDMCIKCGLCEKVCPVLHPLPARIPQIVYAAKNSNQCVRMESSSGGVFSLLAESVLKQGGVVFGARFDEEWQVVHDYTEAVDGLGVFRGSKYVQSRVGDSYSKVEGFLKAGRKVLFSGSPCQVAGLKKFLGKAYEDLVTVDFVCHGVPSPMIWNDYLNEKIRPLGVVGKNMVSHLSLKDLPAITGISFRDKRNGWKKYGFTVRGKSASKADQNLVSQPVSTDESTLFYEPAKENLYMQGFLKNLYLRPSCYHCPAKSGKSGSDYTMADFWGAKAFVGDFDDDKGMSALLVHQDKLCVEGLDMECRTIELANVLAQNPAVVKSSRMKGGRSQFFRKYMINHEIDLIRRYSRYTWKESLRYSCIAVLARLHLVEIIKKILRK